MKNHRHQLSSCVCTASSKRQVMLMFIILFICSCSVREEKHSRPRDPWAFRSVLDKKPRMLTIALDTACYVAYDLANCKIYKVWKGGVLMEGAAYPDKKKVQPTSWGSSYTADLENTWKISGIENNDSFKIINKGYRISSNYEITISYSLIIPGKPAINISEQPEFNNLAFTRTFTTENVPAGIKIFLSSDKNKFELPVNGTAVLAKTFNALPQQFPIASEGEYDHRGRYWMEKSDCFTCHELDKKTVGPSFQEVAGKYGDQENPSITLIPKVKMGSTGVWGTSAMTPHPDLTETEIRVMLDYIFTLKPKKNRPSEQVIKPTDKNVKR